MPGSPRVSRPQSCRSSGSTTFKVCQENKKNFFKATPPPSRPPTAPRRTEGAAAASPYRPYIQRGVLIQREERPQSSKVQLITSRSARRPASSGMSSPRLPRLVPATATLEDVNDERPESVDSGNRTSWNFLRDVFAFEGQLLQLDHNVSERHEPTAVNSKDYHLLKVLFRMTMMDNSAATHRIRETDEDVVMNRIERIRERFGPRRMNRDDFQHQLSEILDLDVERVDSDILFEMFDTNGANFVDDAEFLTGIRMALHDKKRTIAAHCRRFMESRMASGTVVSMMEVEIMLRAVAEVCATRFTGIVKEVERLISALHPQSHHSQIPLLFFRTSVMKTRILSKAMRELSEDAALPKDATPPPSPDPDSDIATLAPPGEKHHKEAKVTVVADKPETQHLPSSRAGSANSGFSTRPPSAAESEYGNHYAGEPYDKLDIRNRRFRADLSMKPNQDTLDHPNEHHNPRFFLRDKSVWMESDLHGPVAIS